MRTLTSLVLATKGSALCNRTAFWTERKDFSHPLPSSSFFGLVGQSPALVSFQLPIKRVNVTKMTTQHVTLLPRIPAVAALGGQF